MRAIELRVTANAEQAKAVLAGIEAQLDRIAAKAEALGVEPLVLTEAEVQAEIAEDPDASPFAEPDVCAGYPCCGMSPCTKLGTVDRRRRWRTT